MTRVSLSRKIAGIKGYTQHIVTEHIPIPELAHFEFLKKALLYVEIDSSDFPKPHADGQKSYKVNRLFRHNEEI